ncbi:MAG: hypothetical protein Q7J54_05495 [Candidatus Woesearchaeota archaeon]|nr:hypothetical protein [Candidatus Woesearchaeota archaeon]
MTKEPKIVLPQNPEIRKALETKLKEYEGRLKKIEEENPCASPEALHCTKDAYKIEIVERLLKKGEVDTWELLGELEKTYGTFDRDDFNKAASVIDDYCKTGGKNVVDGTGFMNKKVDKI